MDKILNHLNLEQYRQEEALRLHYDEKALEYSSLPDQYLEDILSCISTASHKSILDIGCGHGNLVFNILEKYNPQKIIGIDISDEILNIARNRVGEKGLNNCEFIAASSNRLPFKDQSFDIIVSNMVFHHIVDKEKAFTEIIRVAKDDGLVIIQCYGGDTFLPEFFSIIHDSWRKVFPKSKPPDICYPLYFSDLASILPRIGIQEYDVGLYRNIAKIGNNDIEQWLNYFDIVAGHWLYNLDKKVKTKIQSLIRRQIEIIIHKVGYFQITKTRMLLKFRAISKN